MSAACDRPSRSRYRGGCRCAGCVEANAVYKKAWRRRKAVAAGREVGQKPCVRCGESISLVGTSNARKFCDPCAVEAAKEQQAADRTRRRESNRAYFRAYYRANRNRWREYREANRDAIRESNRLYEARNRAALRERGRRLYAKKNPPTVHERALEAFGFRSSVVGDGGRGMPKGGFIVRKCRCGCGLPINAAHVAVVRLTALGYSRQEIGARLGVHATEVSQLRLDAEERSWPWYRRGHGNLKNAKRQPVKARRRLSKDIELRVLVEAQETDAALGSRAKSITGKSLDAAFARTDGLSLIDVVAAPTTSGDYTDTEEALLDWLVRNDIDLDALAGRCRSDRGLAAALAESTELGYPTADVIALLTSERVAA